MTKTATENFRAKYVSLVHKYNRAVAIIKKNTTLFKRLHRNYLVLQQRFTLRLRKADREKRAIIAQSMTDKYALILDHRRRVVYAAEPFLTGIEMTREAFESSFYIDTMFEKFLPGDFSDKGPVAIPPFRLPFVLLDYRYEGDEGLHPFVHYAMSGKREFDAKKKAFLFYLEVQDVSSDVELEYFQKTDKLIRRLTNANVDLMRAKKTIEIHKLMLISLVCSLIEDYNKETSVHLQNIRVLTTCLTAECARLGLIKCGAYGVEEYIKDVNYTSVLHDIGKMIVPQEILEKKGKLTDAEFEAIKRHPVHGAEHIQKMIDLFRADPGFKGYEEFLRIPYDICLRHHERWNGAGYPDGLVGEAIPFSARVVSLVDAYDAMRMRRSYNVPKSHAECLRIIQEESGKQFDPAVVRAFVNIESSFAEIEY